MRRLGTAALLALGLAACGPTVYPIQGRLGAVTFEGELGVEHTDRDERRFILDVRGVPEPWRRAPGSQAYVAWVVSSRRGPWRIARIDYDDLARRARLDERTGEQGDRFRITAEVEPWAREPGPHVLFELDLGPDVPPGG